MHMLLSIICKCLAWGLCSQCRLARHVSSMRQRSHSSRSHSIDLNKPEKSFWAMSHTSLQTNTLPVGISANEGFGNKLKPSSTIVVADALKCNPRTWKLQNRRR